jgi:hypothetical protein
MTESIIWPPFMEKWHKTRTVYNDFTYLGTSSFRKVAYNKRDLNGTTQIFEKAANRTIILSYIYLYWIPGLRFNWNLLLQFPNYWTFTNVRQTFGNTAISTKYVITSHLNSLNIKKTATYDIEIQFLPINLFLHIRTSNKPWEQRCGFLPTNLFLYIQT